MNWLVVVGIVGTELTPSVSFSVVDIDFERALGEVVKRGDMVVVV